MIFRIFLLVLFSFVNCNDKKVYEGPCTVYFENLANALANFTFCSMIYSRPVNFCEKCVGSYIDIIESYDNISKFPEGESKCIDNYTNFDRLEIVFNQYSNSKSLWEQGKCNDCFQIVNGKLTANLSQETVQFNKLLDIFQNCLNANKGGNITVQCHKCLKYYKNLDNFYKNMGKKDEYIPFCMDLVDMMNKTGVMWSDNCCKFRKHEESIFLISAITILILTLLFYVLVKFFSDKTITQVLKQRRFVQSLSESSSTYHR